VKNVLLGEKINEKDLEKLEELGIGGFSKVFKVDE